VGGLVDQQVRLERAGAAVFTRLVELQGKNRWAARNKVAVSLSACCPGKLQACMDQVHVIPFELQGQTLQADGRWHFIVRCTLMCCIQQYMAMNCALQ
jgi:hypothetical protein